MIRLSPPSSPAHRRRIGTSLAFAVVSIVLAGGLLTASAAHAQSATLIAITDTASYTTPSPDPAGITFLPVQDRLLLTDSEVNETPLFVGDNLFFTDRTGTFIESGTSLAYTDEATGVTFDAVSGHLFISSDNAPRNIYEVDSGVDGRFGTADDGVSSFSTVDFGSSDAEGLAWNPDDNLLHVVDGALNRVFNVAPGNNGVFDGVPPEGDDSVSDFDTANLGVTDPEGIVYDPNSGHLYVVGKPKTRVLQVSPSGQFIRTIDLDTQVLVKPAGLALAPSSQENGSTSLFVVDRGIDNDSDPDENDGRLFEFALPPLASGSPPIVQISTPLDDAVFNQGDTVAFAALASDAEDGDLSASIEWTSDLDGPLATGATFNTAGLSTGLHEISASVVDSELTQALTSVSVRIIASGISVIESRIAVSSDDAEQRGPGGNTWLDSEDLELVQDGSVTQVVGLRFTALSLPPGARIDAAWIQFQADQIRSGPVSLTIRAEASDDAAPILGRRDNLTNRPMGGTSRLWSPADWLIVGEAGSDQRTSDIADVVQSIVDRPGWQSGNAMLFTVSGDGPERRTAVSFDSIPDAAPLLHVEYSSAATAPEVVISTPLASSVFSAGSPVQFVAQASDQPYGDLSEAVQWSSNLDGVLGSGASLTVNTLSIGTHEISASVVDSDGLSDTARVSIVVEGDSNQAPVVAITSPADGAEFIAGSVQLMSASAIDDVDGDLSDSVMWTSDRDGQLGSGSPSVTLSTGTHLLTALVTDGSGLVGADSITVSVVDDMVEPGTVSVRIAEGSDDAEERNTGGMALTSSDLELVRDGARDQLVGLRFTDVAIPQGAGILSASIQFEVDEISDEITFLDLSAENSGDAAPFSQQRNDLSSRARTAPRINWMPAPWSVRGEAGDAQRSPDISAALQPVIARGDWASGNALVIFIDGDGQRIAKSFEQSPAAAAELTIRYTLDNAPPLVDAGPDSTLRIGDTLALDGTALDDGLPVSPGSLSTRWSTSDGPIDAVFDDPDALATSVSFPLIGTYRLQLSADDGELISIDERVVTVEASPDNAPPEVDAGADRVLSLGETILLSGTVSDDGLPGSAPLVSEWRLVDGETGGLSFDDAANPATTLTANIAGVYTVSLNAFDGELASSDTLSVTVTDTSGNGSVALSIAGSSDDAEERSGGSMKLNSSDLEMTLDSSEQIVALRYGSVPIPNGAIIAQAYVQFTADESDDTPTTLLIGGHDSGDAPALLGSSGNLSNRPLTIASVGWSPDPWLAAGDRTPAQRTPELASVIQEIVNRPDWTIGNSLALIIQGVGKRVAEAYDGEPTSAATLVIDFQSTP